MKPQYYPSLNARERKKLRLEYIQHQGGKCHYCGASLSDSPTKEVTDKKINRSLFPPSFFWYPVHLHHNHNTGMTIGAVHNLCNAVLWQYHGE